LYTEIVRKWQPVIDAVKKAKADYRQNTAAWRANHTTTASWEPSESYSTDPRAWNEFVQSPPGTDPFTAGFNFMIWQYDHIQNTALYTSAIGSFDIYVTLNNDSTMKVWMFNLMSRKSFGAFADSFPAATMANQWMWWDWTESAN